METPGTQYHLLAGFDLKHHPPPHYFSVNESAIDTLSDTDLEVQKSSEHSPLVMFEINLTV